MSRPRLIAPVLATVSPPSPRRRRAPAVLLAASLLVAACADNPSVTEAPGSVTPSTAASPPPSASELPFRPAGLPADGSSACDVAGYAGLLGRIEAPSARIVRFTLCRPDGAFLARIAHPSLAILDTATLDRLTADPAAGRSLAGTGAFRIDRWDAGTDVILTAVGAQAAAGTGAASDAASGTGTVVIRWAADPAQRLAELKAATVDGIDAPGPLELQQIDTLPELQAAPRAGLATTWLAFGRGRPFSDVRVRRAIAGGIDRAALVAAAFPAGSIVPTHVVPCVIPGACGGADWYEFNAPAAVAALQATGFDFKATIPIHVPSSDLPGLPDPAAVATALAAQLQENLGIRTSLDVMDPEPYLAAAASGTLDGFHLGGTAARLADPSGILEPLLGSGATRELGAPVPAITRALAGARGEARADARARAFARANDAIRAAVPLVPLANPGSMVAFRADVTGVQASPFGTEALGRLTPGDRRQLVFMGSGEPDGAWCGDQPGISALRLCALVTDPLYGFDPGSLEPRPRLARGCLPNADATVWTCTLRAGILFHDGGTLDAGDVLASFAAAWDPTSPLHAARPGASWSDWLALFDAFLGTPAAGGG